MNIRTNYLVVGLTLLLALLNSCEGKAKKPKPCDPGDPDPTCWVMQSEATRKGLKKFGDSCTILYPIIKTSDNETVRDFDNHSLVIDECMDEDNRNFMECVLTYKGSDIPFKNNTGTCQCYREWPTKENPYLPAYDHSLNSETSSEEWFMFDQKLDECVIRMGKKCSPAGQEIVAYRCEKNSRCMILDNDDPRYDICSIENTGSDNFSSMFHLSFAFLLIITQ